MSSAAYTPHGVSLTKGQKTRLRSAFKNKRALSLRLSARQLTGPNQLGLTATQLQQIQQSQRRNKGVVLHLSAAQLSKQGGFLAGLLNLAKFAAPFLAKKVLPALGIGALSGVASSLAANSTRRGRSVKRGKGGRKKVGGRVQRNYRRRPTLTKRKRGGTVFLPGTSSRTIQKSINRLSRLKRTGQGKKKGGASRKRRRTTRRRGKGLILGKNSPFKGIPILGDIF